MTLGTLFLAAIASSAGTSLHADIPAFARRYRVSCARCHIAAPKLNAVGEAFRLNGYRFPPSEPRTREESPLPLGEEPWKDLWPRSIWPGELAATAPIALRIQTDLEMVRDPGGTTVTNFRFPHEIYLLGGGSLGENLGVFLEAEWERDEAPTLRQAKVAFQRVIPWLGERAGNLWVGLQNLYLFTFADRQIDRAARASFLWQRFRSADVPATVGGVPITPTTEFSLSQTQPAIELNGLLGSRVYYAAGVSQGAGSATSDNNRHKDLYYKVRVKLGGIGLDGTYPKVTTHPPGAFGQLTDWTTILETFGYAGSEPDPAGGESRHQHYGASARLVRGPLDLGVGYVWGRDRRPWGSGAGSLDRSSLFGKGEYLFYPWLIGSVKAERFVIWASRGAAGARRFRQDHVMPGLIALVRQNVRLVAEADLYPTYEGAAPGPAPAGLWLRLDLAF